MKIVVGAYELNGTFESREDAEKVFLNDFPSVTPERLQTELNKHFKDADKSRNATEKNTDSEKSNSENSKGGTAKK